MCLKHFRQHHYLDVFDTLQKKTKIQLEHHLLTELHTCLVHNGEFEKTEQLIQKALEGRHAVNIFSLVEHWWQYSRGRI